MSAARNRPGSFVVGSQAALVLPAFITLVVDVVSKHVASDLLPGLGVVKIGSFLNLRLGHNAGVSFGLFPAVTQSHASMLVFATALITILIVWLGLTARESWQKAGVGLIVGGAAANVVDRFRDGLVTDFIDVHAFGWHWPTFNIADVAITCGVALLLFAPAGPGKREMDA